MIEELRRLLAAQGEHDADAQVLNATFAAVMPPSPEFMLLQQERAI